MSIPPRSRAPHAHLQLSSALAVALYIRHNVSAVDTNYNACSNGLNSERKHLTCTNFATRRITFLGPADSNHYVPELALQLINLFTTLAVFLCCFQPPFSIIKFKHNLTCYAAQKHFHSGVCNVVPSPVNYK